MKTAQSQRPDRPRLAAALADQRSRHLLDCLQDGPATVRDLAVAVAAADLGCQRSAVTDDDRRPYRQRLEHRYLPRLTDVGLLDRSPDGFVRSVPGLLDRFAVSFPSLGEPDAPSWTAAAAVVGRAYRYPLVARVADCESVRLSELADGLVDTDCESVTTSRDLAIALHHTDLPKLAAVDLLTYDPDARTATSTPGIETVL